MNFYKGKIALVTGGASGIGLALCLALAQRDTIVIVADINIEGAYQTVASILSEGGTAQALFIDITKYEEVLNAINQVVSQHGRLDFIFNCGGIGGILGEVRDISLHEWNEHFNVNLWGTIQATHAAYLQMVNQGFGHIVNISSLVGLFPHAMGTAYSTVKHALVGLSTSLRGEGADLGVNVSVVCSGYVETNIWNTTTFTNLDRDEFLKKPQPKPMTASHCAEKILRGVERNQAVIVIPSSFIFLGAVYWVLRCLPIPFDMYQAYAHRRIESIRSLRKKL
jgi:NAD(P)-dependent dehydrogenase (short-subunit alcohol dehydrogenase family)